MGFSVRDAEHTSNQALADRMTGARMHSLQLTLAPQPRLPVRLSSNGGESTVAAWASPLKASGEGRCPQSTRTVRRTTPTKRRPSYNHQNPCHLSASSAHLLAPAGGEAPARAVFWLLLATDLSWLRRKHESPRGGELSGLPQVGGSGLLIRVG